MTGRAAMFDTVRYVIGWETWRAGHGGDLPACEDHDLTECVDQHSETQRHVHDARRIAFARASRASDFGFARITRERRSPEGWAPDGWHEDVHP